MFIQLILVALTVFQVDAANVYKQTFTFSDQTQFADLSVYNFDKGLTYTYQYSITARPNREITLYFLTNLTKNANVALYDGADATAPKVDISGAYKITNVASELIPFVVYSTGRNFYLEVTPLTPNAGLKQDFQALASDIVQHDISQKSLGGAPEGCIHMIRTVDTTNNKYALFSINGVDDDASIYKGLSMKPETKIVNLDWVYTYNEKNIVIQHKNPMIDNFGFVYNDDPSAEVLMYSSVNSKKASMFATADYLPARPIGASETTKNGFMFTFMFRVETLKINFLSGVGNGKVDVTYLNYQDSTVNKTVTYTAANLPKSLTINESDAYQFLLSYSCIGTACSGMYGTVEDATTQ